MAANANLFCTLSSKPGIHSHSGICGASDEAVLNTEREINENTQQIPLLKTFFSDPLRWGQFDAIMVALIAVSVLTHRNEHLSTIIFLLTNSFEKGNNISHLF